MMRPTRPAATCLHNLTAILADRGSTRPPGTLDYSIPSQPGTVHDLLLRNSSGAFELVVWGERFTGGLDHVTVNLGAAYATVKVYDPTIGPAPTQTLTHANSVALTLSDPPAIIEIAS